MKKSFLYKILLFIVPLCIAFGSFACTGTGTQSTSKQDSESQSYTEPQSQSASEGESESNVQSESEDESESNVQEIKEPLVDFIVEVEEGRDIRVLQLSDIQVLDGSQQRFQSRIGTAWIGGGGPVSRYFNYLRQVIEKYDPDLIIMAGDNVYGEFDDSGERLLELIDFMDSFEIPWAPILGNHDAETYLGVDWQCEQYESSEYCLFKQRDLTGNGNYTVGLSQGGVLKRVFYMMDTNGSGNLSEASTDNGHTVKFQGFGDDQIDWYTKSITKLKEEYPNVKISFCFHIPIKAFMDAVLTYGYSSDVNTNPINLDEIGRDGDFGIIGNTFSPWDSDYRVWNSFKALGVDSVFVGHEHRNSASIMHEGIRLTFGQKSSTYDTINYYYPSTGQIKGQNDGTAYPMIGGTCIPVSQEDGSIVDPYILLYDKDDPDFVPEADTSNLTIPTVDNLSDTLGSYRGNEFARYTLADLGLEEAALADGFCTQVDSECYSIKFRVKTNNSADFSKGTLRINFLTAEKKRSSYAVAIASTFAMIGTQTVNISLKADTEYDIEVGILRIYGGETVYIFLKIDGELANRWVLDEVTEIKGSYLYVSQSGQSDLCELVK